MNDQIVVDHVDNKYNFWVETNKAISSDLKSKLELKKDLGGYGFESSNKHLLLSEKSYQELTTLNQETINFTNELQKHGIIPLATLPKKLFVQMCLKANTIYRFEHLNERGLTGANLDRLVKHQRENENKIDFLYIINRFLALTVVASFPVVIILSVLQNLFGDQLFRALLPYAFVSPLVMVALFEMFIMAHNKKYLKNKKGPNTLINLLFPEKVDCEHINKSDGVAVNFGKAPESFLQTMNKVREFGFEPCVAADYLIIGIDSDLLEEALLAKQKELDPILYVQNRDKTLIAVCDSFGKFPNEQVVLNWVKKEGLNLVFN